MSHGYTRGVPTDTDPNLAANSDLFVPSQKAVKTYVDTRIPVVPGVFTSVAAGLVPASGGGTANFLRADGSFAAPPATAFSGVRAIRSNSQNIGTGSATDIIWESVDYDSGSFWAASPNPERLTCGFTGSILCVGFARCQNNVTGQRTLALRKNGVNQALAVTSWTLLNVDIHLIVTAILNVVPTDYITLVYSQDSGGTLALRTNLPYLGIQRLL